MVVPVGLLGRGGCLGSDCSDVLPPASRGPPPSRSPLVLLVVRVGGDVIVVQLPPERGRLRGVLPLAGGAAAGAGPAALRSRTASVHRPHARVLSGGPRPEGPIGPGTLLKAYWAASGSAGDVFSIQQTAHSIFENPPRLFPSREMVGEIGRVRRGSWTAAAAGGPGRGRDPSPHEGGCTGVSPTIGNVGKGIAAFSGPKCTSGTVGAPPHGGENRGYVRGRVRGPSPR